MISFLLSISILVLAFVFYSKVIERFFGANNANPTPAIKNADGVDFVVMPSWKIYTIQFLNIAGLGPIFGAILGAMYGPAAYIWIVFGCIFIGATHDYISGMLSLRNNGASLPEIIAKYLGKRFIYPLRVFTLLLLLMVGVAFVNGPAELLGVYTGIDFKYWLYVIFAYYLMATLLPINKIIGKIYPLFGAILIMMALAIAGYMIWGGFTGRFTMHEVSYTQLLNQHAKPSDNLLYPMLFIVISCGAISGFHATQSPMMARCIKNEGQGRYVFFGAMITEGIVAIIWATVAMNFFGNVEGLNETIASGKNPAWIVKEICQTWFGKLGAIITILGVIAAPITTGDTAFRSARLIIADSLKLKQTTLQSRVWISVPLFVIAFILTQIEFVTIWKFLGLFNQILSVFTLWACAMYLQKNQQKHWLLSIPATFMTSVCISFLCVAPIKNGGLALDPLLGNSVGIVSAVLCLWLFLRQQNKYTLS